MITLKELWEPLKTEIAWMRIYLGSWHGTQVDCMSMKEMQDAVRAWGDCKVRLIKPGFYSVIVVVEP